MSTESINQLSHPLVEACAEGRLRDIGLLIDAGADPNASVEEIGRFGIRTVYPLTAGIRLMMRDDMTPRLAVRQVQRVFQILLERGAKLQKVERELLTYCIRLGQDEILLFLAERGARLHRYGTELMEESIAHLQSWCIEALKSRGIDPNVRNGWGSTVLLEISAGAVELADDIPCMHAPRTLDWYVSCLEMLKGHGVDLNARDRNGATPLMRALVTGQTQIARALLVTGADPTAMLSNGVTAVHLAARVGAIEELRHLISNHGMTADLARLKARKLQPDVKAFMAAVACAPA